MICIYNPLINPFAFTGRTGTSKGKVKVRDICLNISFLTWIFHSYMKKKFKVSPKKRSLDVSLQHKNEASYKFSKKKLLHSAETRTEAERFHIALNLSGNQMTDQSHIGIREFSDAADDLTILSHPRWLYAFAGTLPSILRVSQKLAVLLHVVSNILHDTGGLSQALLLTLSAPALYIQANPRAPASICGWKNVRKSFIPIAPSTQVFMISSSIRFRFFSQRLNFCIEPLK